MDTETTTAIDARAQDTLVEVLQGSQSVTSSVKSIVPLDEVQMLAVGGGTIIVQF